MAFKTVSVEIFLKSLGDLPTLADRIVTAYEPTAHEMDYKDNERAIFFGETLKHANAYLQSSGLDQHDNLPCIVPMELEDFDAAADVDLNPFELVIPVACGPKSLDLDSMSIESCAEAKALEKYLGRRYFSRGFRRFVIGIVAAGLNLSICYFSRASYIKTEPFNMFVDQDLFLRVIAVMRHLCNVNVGREDVITPSITHPLTRATLRLGATPRDDDPVVDIQVESLDCTTYLLWPTSLVLTVLDPKSLGNNAEDNLIARLNWLNDEENEEAIKARMVRERVDSTCRHHIPEIWHFSTEHGELPGGSMRPHDAQTDLTLHILVCPKPVDVEYIKNSQEFRSVFIESVKYHRAAYDQAHFLHKNISPSTVKALPHKGNLIGLLDHWKLGGLDNSPRSGTCLFFAIDLLVTEETRPHRYRHDLESFFYVLVWFLESKQPPEDMDSDRYAFYDKNTSSWRLHEVEKNYKLAFLREAPERQCEKLLEGLNPDFVWVVHDWFLPLMKMLQDAYAVGKTEEDRDSLFTYDKFMGVLDAEGQLASAQSG